MTHWYFAPILNICGCKPISFVFLFREHAQLTANDHETANVLKIWMFWPDQILLPWIPSKMGVWFWTMVRMIK